MDFFYGGLKGVKYDTKRKQLYAWRAQADAILAASKKPGGKTKKKHRPRGVRTALLRELELQIIAWVNRLRGEGVPISRLMLTLYAMEVAEGAGVTAFKGSSTWLRLFLRRHRLSMRSRTRQGQIKPEEAAARAAEFALKVQRKMEELGIKIVHNADQTGTS
jgi:hypothetical protein